MLPFMIKGNTVELMKFDINTPIKTKVNYFGLVYGLSKYLAMSATIEINNTFDIADINEAPICIKLAYNIVLDKL